MASQKVQTGNAFTNEFIEMEQDLFVPTRSS